MTTPHLGQTHLRILRYVEARVLGATDDEIALDLGIAANSMRPRRRELVAAGKLEASDHQRLSFAGHQATVWVACNHPPGETVPRSKAKAIAAAAEPFVLKADAILGEFSGHRDDQMVAFPITFGALRALVKAAGA